MSTIQFIMTDEIAYKLGKFDFPSFYSYVTWRPNKEPFELAAFFDWSLPLPGGLGGWPCKRVGEEYTTDWENISVGGRLKTEKISEISHKLNYIRGRLKSYSVAISPNSIEISYANSYDFRDFIAECFRDVIRDRFELEPKVEGELGRKFRANIPKYFIKKTEIVGTIPGTPGVYLEADKEVIDYIIN